eukprot:3797420-Pyramimonas_sp.AAC.1
MVRTRTRDPKAPPEVEGDFQYDKAKSSSAAPTPKSPKAKALIVLGPIPKNPQQPLPRPLWPQR